MNFVEMLPKMAKFSPNRITIGATERTVRRRLKLKKGDPLVWQGIPLNCIGSARWRRQMREYRSFPAEPNLRCAGCGKKTCTTSVVCDACYALAGG
jgi:hypothetical protein